jgi:hypothetical protein
MASTAQQLPNHYDVLGLTPTASPDEITRAFAKAMSMFGARPIAVAAHLSHAFEVLRNPEKRRVYDRSIGLAPTPRPYGWQFAIAAAPGAPFIASTPASSMGQAAGVATVPEPQVTEDPEAPAQADVAAAQLSPLSRRQPRQVADERVDTVVEHILAVGHAEKALLRRAGHRSHDWRRPAMMVGGLVLGAGLIGTIAGLSASGPADQQATVTVPLSAARARPAAELPSSAQEPTSVAGGVEAPTGLAAPAQTIRRTGSLQQPAPLPSQEADDVQVADSGDASTIDAVAADPLAPEPASVQPAAARLPLPNAVIARTIERIGYACASVGSIAPVEGAPGVFDVKCTSGHSYRASPVGGRYHFRRSRGR